MRLTGCGGSYSVGTPLSRSNVRQLKNITEQISIIETSRDLTAERLNTYLYPMAIGRCRRYTRRRDSRRARAGRSCFGVLYDISHDMDDLKQLVYDLMRGQNALASRKLSSHSINVCCGHWRARRNIVYAAAIPFREYSAAVDNSTPSR